MKKMLICIFIPFICSCSYPKNLCDECKNEEQCEKCQCVVDQEINLNINYKEEKEEKIEEIGLSNFYEYFRVDSVFIGTDGSYGLYSAQINGVLTFGTYSGIICLKTIGAVDHDDNEILYIDVDKSGYGKTTYFKYNFSGLLEDFCGFSIESVDAKFSYYI